MDSSVPQWVVRLCKDLETVYNKPFKAIYDYETAGWGFSEMNSENNHTVYAYENEEGGYGAVAAKVINAFKKEKKTT